MDEVHGKQQVLVRKPGKEEKLKPGLRGQALLADGKIGWILDTRELAKSIEKGTEGKESNGTNI